MENLSTREFCRRFDACRAGTRFALKFATMRDCYAALLAGEAGEDSAGWAIWAITRPGVTNDRDLRVFAVRCASRVQNLTADARSIAALDVAERYALGKATDKELSAAADAARAAAWAAADDAARAAAWAAADDAARAASAAAADAASAAAADAAKGAARDAADDAARAARDAADAADAARYAARAVARDAAWDAERKAQLAILAEFGNPFEEAEEK